jgi:predicted ArsR family transcriptional regulator
MVGMDAVESDGQDLAAIGLLREPVRRALYDYVASQDGEVSRNEAAEAVGVQRGLAAFHLDKLVDGGLLDATFRRLGERRGPGAGRPAKLYRRAAREVAASLPPRAYQAAAHLLAEAVEQAGAEPELYASARRHGEASGRQLMAGEAKPTAERALAALGYEPYQDGEALRLRNCPFSTLAREFPVVTCGMSLALIEGLLAGLGAAGVSASMDPAPGRCCVAIHGSDVSKTKHN